MEINSREKLEVKMYLIIFMVLGSLVGCGFSDTDVIMAANKLIEKELKAPSTAKFDYPELGVPGIVVDRKMEGDVEYYLIKSTVDSENSFGSMVRNTYLVVMQVKMKEKKVGWLSSAAKRVSNPPTQEEINTIKALNQWP